MPRASRSSNSSIPTATSMSCKLTMRSSRSNRSPLGEQMKQLPKGWQYRTRALTEDLVLDSDSILSWKVVGEVRAATLATSGLAADDVSAFNLPNDSLPRHTFLHRFGQRWSSISSELSRGSTCRRIRYRRFSQLGGLWASCANTPRSSAFRSSLHGHVHTTLKVGVALISRYGSGSLKLGFARCGLPSSFTRRTKPRF